MVEELFPASVSVVAEVDVDEWVVPGFYGPLYELHAGELWSPAALSDVAAGAGADYVLPHRFAAQAAGDNVVER